MQNQRHTPLKLPKRLQNYLSNGEIPHDFVLHAIGEGELKALCVFCQKAHKSYSCLPLKGPVMLTTMKEKTVMCGVCGDCSSVLVDKLGISDLMFNSRMDMFFRSGEYPIDIDLYASGNLHESKCGLCKQFIGPIYSDEYYENFGTILPIPQGMFNVILGEFSLCNSCWSIVDTTKGLMDKDSCWDECYNCKSTYELSRLEYMNRLTNKTLGHHECDDCLRTKYYINVNRYSQVACICEKNKTMDLDITLEKYYHDMNNHEYFFTCEECKKFSDEINKGKYKISLFKRGDNYHFKILTQTDAYDSNGIFNSTDFPDTGWNKPYMAAFEAAMTLNKLIKNDTR